MRLMDGCEMGPHPLDQAEGVMEKEVTEKIGKVMGESLLRGWERENERKMELLMLRLRLITLEVDILTA